MKLTTENSNYCATIVRVHTLLKLEGLDNLLGFPCFGLQALVSKDTEVGQLCVLFTCETELSPQFCQVNNLFRHKELNIDQDKVGYLDDSRRIRAIKLRKHTSNALLMPLNSLEYLGIDVNELKEGDCFDAIDGIPICTKYIVRQTQGSGKNRQPGQKKTIWVDVKLMPEHHKTENFWKNIDKYKPDDYIYVTQKLHGTSGRMGNVLVNKKLTWFQKLLKRFGIKIVEQEYKCIAGSRHVIKYKDAGQHYYDSDIWNAYLEKIQHIIPKNWIIYVELVGYIGEKPIQKHYCYRVNVGEYEAYVYRISVVNNDGITVDLTFPQVMEFCNNNALKHVPLIWEGKFKYFIVEDYIDVKFRQDLGLLQCLPLDDEAKVDEGVVVMKYGLQEYFTKAKSPIFLGYETKLADDGEVDIESLEALEIVHNLDDEDYYKGQINEI